MKNPFPNCPPKQNMGLLVPPGCPINDQEIIVRAPGELPSDEILRDWHKLELQLAKEEDIIMKSLSELSERTGMPITQENGQRRYGPPLDFVGSPPPRGSEVFVGKLPRNCYEPELVPVLEQVGKIFEMRLMMNFSGNNRGYCFVQYYNPIEAERAVRELNNFEIRKGCQIGIVKSVDNCRLFIGNLPRDKDDQEIRKEFDKLCDGVIRVIAQKSVGGVKDQKNRGYAFIEFESHRSAAMARRKLVPGKLKMWGRDIAVDWAEPVPEHLVIVVSNLSPVTSESALAAMFNMASNNGVARVDKLTFNYATISFETHYQAELAMNAMNGKIIDGCRIRVKWNKFASDPSKYVRRRGCKFRSDFNFTYTDMLQDQGNTLLSPVDNKGTPSQSNYPYSLISNKQNCWTKSDNYQHEGHDKEFDVTRSKSELLNPLAPPFNFCPSRLTNIPYFWPQDGGTSDANDFFPSSSPAYGLPQRAKKVHDAYFYSGGNAVNGCGYYWPSPTSPIPISPTPRFEQQLSISNCRNDNC